MANSVGQEIFKKYVLCILHFVITCLLFLFLLFEFIELNNSCLARVREKLRTNIIAAPTHIQERVIRLIIIITGSRHGRSLNNIEKPDYYQIFSILCAFTIQLTTLAKRTTATSSNFITPSLCKMFLIILLRFESSFISVNEAHHLHQQMEPYHLFSCLQR